MSTPAAWCLHRAAEFLYLSPLLLNFPEKVFALFFEFSAKCFYLCFPTQCEVSYDKDEPESWSNNMDNWLYVPQGSRALYEKTEPWCYFETIKEF